MEPPRTLTPRERLVRIGGGGALVAASCVIFVVSMRADPRNRAAWLAIIGILVGCSLVGQGVRGRRDGSIQRVEPVQTGPTVSAERTVAGILLAWILPGLGHWVIGRRGKAILFFATITTTFLAGILLAEGRNLDYERDGVYFLAYMFNAGETALGVLFTRHLEPDHAIPYLQVGFLYTAVACLLNLVAVMDFAAICGRPVDASGTQGPAPETALGALVDPTEQTAATVSGEPQGGEDDEARGAVPGPESGPGSGQAERPDGREAP